MCNKCNINATDIKPGDKLTFEVLKVFPSQTSKNVIQLQFKGAQPPNRVDPASIQHHDTSARPLAVGDKVRRKFAALGDMTIVGIHEDWAWCRVTDLPESGLVTYPLSELVRE